MRAPSSPPAARPQTGSRPASTARAPSARAVATSAPRRIPPSSSTSSRLVDGVEDGRQRLERRQTPSSWRPPWSRRRSRAAPCSAASTASSASRTPLTTTGTGRADASSARKAQSRAGSSSVRPWPCAPSRARAGRREHRRPGTSSHAALPVARAEDGQVDGQEHGRVAGVQRLGDQLARDAVVAEDVDLEEPGRVGRSRRYLAGRRGREGREAERGARRSCSPRQAFLAVRMEPAAGRRPARRRPASRPRARAASSRSTSTDPRENTLPQPPRRERRRGSRRAFVRHPPRPRGTRASRDRGAPSRALRRR